MDQEQEIAGEIWKLQTQINDLETGYLERNWYDGNVYIGWNKNISANNPAQAHVRINVDAKERIFSLSSITSPAFQELL